MTKQIHLAAHFPGVNNTTVWSDPAAGSHIEFGSFREFAQIAERGKFDFLFLAEGLRLREQGGQIYDLDVVGRPDTFTVLSALAAVTDRLGLAGFRLRPAVIPDDLEAITRELVPELQRRALFRTAYEASTLRGLLGMNRPASRYAPAAAGSGRN